MFKNWVCTTTFKHNVLNYSIGGVYFKGSQMGHSVKVSLWCVTLLINTRFRFLQLLSTSDVTLEQRASK